MTRSKARSISLTYTHRLPLQARGRVHGGPDQHRDMACSAHLTWMPAVQDYHGSRLYPRGSRFSCRGGGLIMQYSWPGPVPPGGRRGTIRLIRCARCKGPLYYTKTKGQPRQEDHEQGCEAFNRAIRVMRYVDELNRSASGSAVVWGRNWRRRYLRENAKRLSVAACESDPAAAISALADHYQAECQTRGNGVELSEKTEMAETLMRACRQLALGQDPAPITPRPS